MNLWKWSQTFALMMISMDSFKCLKITIATSKITSIQSKLIKNLVTSVVSFSLFGFPSISNADMLTFPLPGRLKNNIAFVRSGESFADARHETQTNPVKKLRQDNALTATGQQQAREAAKKLQEMDFSPSFIWVSNTERAFETAAIIARECQLGQNRIVPEYSFLDARAVGIYEGKNTEETWKAIHTEDEQQGIYYRAPPNTDGTPTDSVADVLVRGNQLLSTIDSMYSGENVLVVSPDSEILSILTAAMSDETPDQSLPTHARFAFANGEVRRLEPVVKPRELLVTGQSRAEADAFTRKMRMVRVGDRGAGHTMNSWVDLWHLAVDGEGF